MYSLYFISFIIYFINLTSATKFPYYHPIPKEDLLKEDKNHWFKIGEEILKKNLKLKEQTPDPVAKNVIIFLGDGMGISTISATRIYKGQQMGKSGEEHSLVYENFPNVGLVKTYSVDMQIPDSAATATALFTGVKANFYTVGVDVRSNRTIFSEKVYQESKIDSIMDWAQKKNKDTGIITTTRITHATPAATYAHVNDRNWECDSKIPKTARPYCKDIARQLVEDAPGKNFKVILGGGYQQLGYNSKNESTSCMREDGKNLTKIWLENHRNTAAKFVTNNEQLDAIDPSSTDYLLGLFHANHLPYELLRDKSGKGTPSLLQMVKKGLKILQKSKNGYVLMVEGGRIDHGHHENFARLALEESAQFDEAIAWVTSEIGSDTSIYVTADHSHSMTFNGYAYRGNDILGYGIDDKDEDMKPALTITYANGPGFKSHYGSDYSSILGPWKDPRSDPNRLENAEYRHMATYEVVSETHGGEDVALFARGPGSDLVRGVMEQNYLAHVISYSACIGPRSSMNPYCEKHSNSLQVRPNVVNILIGLLLLITIIL